MPKVKALLGAAPATALACLLWSCGGMPDNKVVIEAGDTVEHAHPELPNVAWRKADNEGVTLLRFKKRHNSLLYEVMKSRQCGDGGAATASAKVVITKTGYVAAPDKVAITSAKNCAIDFDKNEMSYVIADKALTITSSKTKAKNVFYRAPALDLKLSCLDIKRYRDQGQQTCLEVYSGEDTEASCVAAGGKVALQGCRDAVSPIFAFTCPRHTVTETGQIASSMLYFYGKKPAFGCPQ